MPRVTQTDKVHEQVAAWIAHGRFKPGARLPSERQIASDLKVHRKAVHQAILSMERNGTVRRRSERIYEVATDAVSSSSPFDGVVVVVTSVQYRNRQSVLPVSGLGQEALFGVMETIEEHGMSVLTQAPARLDERAMERMLKNRPFGMAVLGDALLADGWNEKARRLLDRGIPMVVNDEENDPDQANRPSYDVVLSDHRQGAYELTAYLAKLGCRRILRVWDRGPGSSKGRFWLAERNRGYESACRDLGLDVLPFVEPALADYDPASKERFDQYARMIAGFLVEHLSRPSIDGVLVLSDRAYYHVAAACRLFGKVPNKEIKIGGFDNYWFRCHEREWEPSHPIATVDKDAARLGNVMIETLRDRVAGRLDARAACIRIKTHLVIPE